MSKLERVLRIALAIVAFSLGVYFSTWWGIGFNSFISRYFCCLSYKSA